MQAKTAQLIDQTRNNLQKTTNLAFLVKLNVKQLNESLKQLNATKQSIRRERVRRLDP